MARRRFWEKVKTEFGKFESQDHANRFAELKTMEDAGTISNLQYRAPFDLHLPSGDKFVEMTVFWADFIYHRAGQLVVEAVVLGRETDLAKLRKRWMMIEHGIEVLDYRPGKKKRRMSRD